MGRPLGQRVGDRGLSVRKNAASRGRFRFCNGQSLCSRFYSERFCANVEISRAASHQYRTGSEATGCHTQQSDRKNHSGKLSVTSGRSAPGSVKSSRLAAGLCNGQSHPLQPTTCQ